MPGRRLLPAAFVAALACSGGAFAAGPAAPLPAGWSHAEINVSGPRGLPHTLIYDRGRVQSVGSSTLTLLERDGSIVTVEVAPDAVVRIGPRRASLAEIRPGSQARTLRVDGKPATRVIATKPLRRSR